MRRRLFVALAAIAATLALAATVVVRIPEGGLAIVAWRAGGTPVLVGSGWSLAIPILQRVDVYPGGQVAIDGIAVVPSREGSEISLPYHAAVTPPPQALLALHAEAERGGGAGEGLRLLVESGLRKSAAEKGTYDLASGAAGSDLAAAARNVIQEKLGAAPTLTLATPVVSAEVRAAFEREAIYGRARDTGLRVILVGIDGADWDFIAPMIARGELPHLARLRKDGAWGRLRSSIPTLSPLLWTTVATGKAPDRHGINDFLVADPATGQRVPINSTFRKTKALWNILTEARLPSDTIAWWATWPAESVEGHIVSDRVAYSTFNLSGPRGGRGAVYPPDYAATVERLRVTPEAVTHRQIQEFLQITPAEFQAANAPPAGVRAPARGDAPSAAASMPSAAAETRESIRVMTRILASTETYRRVALDLLAAPSRPAAAAEGRAMPRLFAVYFQGVDEVNHRFAHCAPPRSTLCSNADTARFRDAVASFYRYQDRILGEIVAAAPGATVIVMSDHGFASGETRPREDKPFIEGKPGLWHDLVGIFVAAGPGVRRGEISAAVTLYDIAPTILYLLGLPVAEDMPGQVIEAALREEFLKSNPAARVPSYEGLASVPSGGAGERDRRTADGAGMPDPGGLAPEDAAAPEIVEQLRSLGYIGGDAPAPAPLSPGAETAPRPAQTGAPTAPGAPPAGQGASGSGVAPAPPPGAGAGAMGGVPLLLYHTNLGTVYLGKRQYEQAEAEFATALKIDPESRQALSGMVVLYQAQGQPEKALGIVRRLIALDQAGDSLSMVKAAELFIAMRRPLDGVAYLDGLRSRVDRSAKAVPGHRVATGLLYVAAGRPRDAENAFFEALAADVASVHAMQELFALYDADGRLAELEPRLRKALARQPRSPMHHNWLGLVLKRRGDLEGAAAELRRALELAPDLVGAMANLGAIALQQGRTGEAVTVLRRAVEKDPGNVESRTNLIVALGTSGDLEGARALLVKAEERGQRVPLFYNALAYALLVNGRRDEALETVRRALALDPRQADALRLQAEIEGGQPVPLSPYR